MARTPKETIQAVTEAYRRGRLDDFTEAHLLDTMTRIDKALDAEFNL